MTDGILVNRAFTSSTFETSNTIIVDEAHECNANIALLLPLVRRAVESRKDLRVVIMSATIATNQFIGFFGGPTKVGRVEIPVENYRNLRSTIWGHPARNPVGEARRGTPVEAERP